MTATENTAHRRWEITEDICRTPGAALVTVYGVRITDGDRVWEWQDVDPSEARLRRWIGEMSRMDIDPVHFDDVVQDYIHR